jgi:hypothetical protein
MSGPPRTPLGSSQRGTPSRGSTASRNSDAANQWANDRKVRAPPSYPVPAATGCVAVGERGTWAGHTTQDKMEKARLLREQRKQEREVPCAGQGAGWSLRLCTRPSDGGCSHAHRGVAAEQGKP